MVEESVDGSTFAICHYYIAVWASSSFFDFEPFGLGKSYCWGFCLYRPQYK